MNNKFFSFVSYVFMSTLYILPALLLYSLSLYYPALTLPWAYFNNATGFTLLKWGWYGVLSLNFAWFANITFLVGTNLFFLKKYIHAIWVSLASLFLGSTTFMLDSVHHNGEMKLYYGFYLWLGSFACLGAISFYFMLYNNSNQIDDVKD